MRLINGSRVALTGQGVAPSLFAVMAALGKERVTKRLKAAGSIPSAKKNRGLGKPKAFPVKVRGYRDPSASSGLYWAITVTVTGNGVRGHAGVGVAGLVVQASFQDVLSRLRRQVSMQNELAGVDTELLLGARTERHSRCPGEIDGGDVETRTLPPPRAARDQDFSVGRVGVNVQPVGYAEMKIDLGGVSARGQLPGREKGTEPRPHQAVGKG